MTIVPAFGRDYKSKKALMTDWDDNKDFLIQDLFESGLINKAQALKECKGKTFNARYKCLREVCLITIK